MEKGGFKNKDPEDNICYFHNITYNFQLRKQRKHFPLFYMKMQICLCVLYTAVLNKQVTDVCCKCEVSVCEGYELLFFQQYSQQRSCISGPQPFFHQGPVHSNHSSMMRDLFLIRTYMLRHKHASGKGLVPIAEIYLQLSPAIKSMYH